MAKGGHAMVRTHIGLTSPQPLRQRALNALRRHITRLPNSDRGGRKSSGSLVAPFVPTPYPVIQRMLKLADLRPEENLYDLGCGDGRILTVAVQEFEARAVGVELRKGLVSKSRVRVDECHLNGRVQVIHDDLYQTDLSNADVVTVYLSLEGNERLRPQLETMLKNGARVVTHDYEIFGWKPSKIEKFKENSRVTRTIFLYTHSLGGENGGMQNLREEG